MTSWMRNQIANLYNFLSAPMIATIVLPKKSALLLYNRIMYNIGHGHKKMKGIVEKEARKKDEEEQIEDESDLTLKNHERALKDA